MDETIGRTARNDQQAIALAGAAVGGGARARRDFLRLVGLGAGAAALAACGESVNKLTGAAAGAPAAAVAVPPGATITYDFGRADDLGVLNFAYAMEQLGVALYQAATGNAAFTRIFSAAEQRVLRDFLGHELSHQDFFTAALGDNGTTVTPNFSSVDFTSRASVLNASKTFENTCVYALNGSGLYLRNAPFLAIAGKLVSAEARQASAVNDLLNPKSLDFAPDIVDPGYTPQRVVGIVQPFVQQTLSVVNT